MQLCLRTRKKQKDQKKEVTCFRCKIVGHYESKCDVVLPSKTPKSGSNMLIADEVSSMDKDQDINDQDEQYHAEDYDIEDKPIETSKETFHEISNT